MSTGLSDEATMFVRRPPSPPQSSESEMAEKQPANKQDILHAIVWAGAVFLLAFWLLPRWMTPPPSSTPPPTSGAPQASPTPSAQGGPSQGAAPTASSNYSLAQGTLDSFVLGDATPGGPYRMRVEVTSRGAGITRVELSDHLQSIGSSEPYHLLSPIAMPPVAGGGGSEARSLIIEKINVDGVDVPLADALWTARKLDWPEGEAVELAIQVLDSGSPALKLTRTFRLSKQTVASGLHDLLADLQVTNLSEQKHDVIVTWSGGMGVAKTGGRGEARGFNFATLREGKLTGHRKSLAELEKQPSNSLLVFDPQSEASNATLVWAAQDNQYFTCTLAPLARAVQTASPAGSGYIRQVFATDADGAAATTDDATLHFVTAQEALGPASATGSSLEYPLEVYLGPKSAKSFKGIAKYVERNYYFQVTVGYGWCTFTWLVEAMIALLNGLHWVVRDYGIALVILVLIVRTCLHPLTKWGQVNMVRMQKRMGDLQPKLEEIRKKYANDKLKQQQEVAALWRDAGINPAGQMLTCLPMFFQVPIWGALYLSLATNILMRHQPFLWSWPRDLTAPDGLLTFSPIHLPIFGTLESFNLLPFLLGASMYIQQKLMPKPPTPPNQTPEQKAQAETMQTMMPMMSVMMIFLFYRAPSGLNLYIMASSIFGAIEQHRIRTHIKEQEALGTLYGPKRKETPAGPRRKSRIELWLERVQKMSEQARRNAHGARRRP